LGLGFSADFLWHKDVGDALVECIGNFALLENVKRSIGRNDFAGKPVIGSFVEDNGSIRTIQ
jgi:hypothetical protein